MKIKKKLKNLFDNQGKFKIFLDFFLYLLYNI